MVKAKLLSTTLLATLSLALLTGCTDDNASANSTTTNDTTQATESKNEVTLQVLMPSHANYPFNSEWEILDIVNDVTGVTLKADAILNTNSAFQEKLTTTMVSGNLPDLIFPINNNAIKTYGGDGAFVNILDHMDKLPNFSAWYAENEVSATPYKSADGSLYQFPSAGTQDTNRYGWMYREDIFEEHGLEIPTSEEEFYNLLVKLKELYPSSYPLAFRSGFELFNHFAPQWGTYSMADGAARYASLTDDGEWVFAPVTDEAKEMYEFFYKLHQEGLIIPNFLSIAEAGWEEAMASDISFITIEYLGRIDTLNAVLRKSNPEFTISYMPPFACSENGKAQLTYPKVGFYGYIITSTTKNLDSALEFCDFWYSDEGYELASWGKEGVHFEKVDGENEWIDLTEQIEMRTETGLSTYGLYQLYDYDASLKLATPELQEAYETARLYDAQIQPQLAWTDEEKAIIDTVAIDISDYAKENVSLFLTGQRSFDEWDDFVAKIEDMGLQSVLDAHKSAYDRVK